MTPEVSIIIPVYNKKPYLPGMLESLRNQTFESYEVILVNDGSTDGSAELLKSFAETDPRLSVIYSENKGASGARNTGLSAASGEWIQFLDADDTIDADYLSKAVEAGTAEEADIVFTDFEMVDEAGKTLKQVVSGKKTAADACRLCRDFMELQPKNGFFGFISNKLFRKNLLDKTGAVFDTEIRLAEDLDFYTHLYVGVKKAIYLDICSFYYLQTPENYRNNAEIDYFVQLKIRLNILDWIRNIANSERYNRILEKRAADYAYIILFEDSERRRSLHSSYVKLVTDEKVMECIRSGICSYPDHSFKRAVLQALIDHNEFWLKVLFAVRRAVRGAYRKMK